METPVAREDHDDILWDRPEGYSEEHPGGRYLFRWEGVTWQIRSVKDDPDCWVVRGTGGEYRVDVAAGTCVCKGNTRWGRCKHVDTMTHFLLSRGSTAESDEEMSEDELRKLFA